MSFDDRYACTEPLLRGEIGTLWRGEDRKLHRPVAIALLDDASGAERFLAMAQTLATHPNTTLRTLERGTREDGTAFCVIEPPPGAPFAGRLGQPPQLLVEDVTRVALEVLAELESIHAAGVTHGRIDPWTVWVAARGKQLSGRLVGLGLYRASVESRSALELAYTAPELLREGTFGPRCDVWSMGVLLYACLTGQHPFARESIEATRAAVLAGQAPSVASLAVDLPPALVAAIEKALTADPNARFEDAKAMRRAVFVAMLSAGKRGKALVRAFDADKATGAAAPAPRPPAPNAAAHVPPPPPVAEVAPEPARELARPPAAPPQPSGHMPKTTIVGFAPPAAALPLPESPAKDVAPPPTAAPTEPADEELSLPPEPAEPAPASPPESGKPALAPRPPPHAPPPPPARAAPLPPPHAPPHAPPPTPPLLAEELPSVPADFLDAQLSPGSAPSDVTAHTSAPVAVFGRPEEHAAERKLPPPARTPPTGARDWRSAPPPAELTSAVVAQAAPPPPPPESMPASATQAAPTPPSAESMPAVLVQAAPEPPPPESTPAIIAQVTPAAPPTESEPAVIAQIAPAPPPPASTPVIATQAAQAPPERAKAPSPVSASPSTPPPTVDVDLGGDAPTAKSHRWVWATATLAALVVAGAGYGWYVTQGGAASTHPANPEPARLLADQAPAPTPAAPPPAAPAATSAPAEPDAGTIAAPSEPTEPSPSAIAEPPTPVEPTVPAVAAAPLPEEPAPAVPGPRTRPEVPVGRHHARPPRHPPAHRPGLVGDPGF